jgi:hypothetical protein
VADDENEQIEVDLHLGSDLAWQAPAADDPARPSSSSHKRRRALAGGAGVLAASAIGVGAWVAPGHHGQPLTGVGKPAPSKPGHGSAGKVANKAVADRKARQLLGDIRLPSGNHLQSDAPEGTPSAMRQADQVPGTPYLVDLARYWATGTSQSQAVAWLQAHEPLGSHSGGSGYSSGPGFYVQDLQFTWNASGVLQTEWMQVSVASVGSGSVVRFDAQVVYYPKRPQSEAVPPGVVRIVISTEGSSRGTSEVTVTNPETIAKIEGIVGALRGSTTTMQPGGPCLGVRAMSESYKLDFYVGNTAVPAAVVTGQPWSNGLDNVGMTVGGKRQPGLFDADLALGDLVAKISRVTWPSPYCGG